MFSWNTFLDKLSNKIIGIVNVTNDSFTGDGILGNTDKINHLVEEIFELTFSKEDIPFQTTILPLEYSNLTYIISGNPKTVNKQTEYRFFIIIS